MKNRIMTIKALAVLSLIIIPVALASPYIKRNQTTQKQPQSQGEPHASQTAVDYAKRVAAACRGGRWEEQPCLKAVSENNLVLAANYAAALDERGKKAQVETIKEHCAASTAATRGEYPAYAMRSAFVECANIIVDVQGATGLSPDLSQYQLLVGAVQCLDKTVACQAIEQGLSQYQ